MNSSERNEAAPSSELDQNMELLRQTYFFSGFPLEILKVFAYLCNREVFKRGEYIFLQGEDDGQAFFIIEGQAAIEREDNDSTKRIRSCKEGDFLGGLALMGTMHRLFSFKAETDITCLMLSREKFNKTIEQFPDLMPKILKALVNVIDTWEESFLSERTEKCSDCLENLGVSLL